MNKACILAAALAAAWASNAAFGCGGITVEDPQIKAPPPEAGVLAGYARLLNPGNVELSLTGADSPEFALVEFHSMSRVGNAMRMRPEKQLAIPARGELVFSPGKLHIMLFKPGREFRAGDVVKLNLHCGSGQLAVDFKVTDP
jgi:copper(I)-binding protein